MEVFKFQTFAIFDIIIRTYSSCFMREVALFQNIFKFCTFLPKFSNILPFFSLFLKNRMHTRTL